MAHVRDPVDGHGIGRLVLLDPHPHGPELGDGGVDVRDAPGHLGLGVLGADGALRHDELRAAAAPEDDAVVRDPREAISRPRTP